MSAGWSKQGSGVPLADRVRPSSTSGSTEGHCPARHCWVADGAEARGIKRPGLLVEWRRHEGGWEGRVVYAVSLRSDRWSLVEEWLPASALTPL